jgi:hypothetical protein
VDYFDNAQPFAQKRTNVKRSFSLLPESRTLRHERPAEFALCGWASVTVEPAALPALRGELSQGETALSLSELKRSDEQTLVGLAALTQAFRASGLPREAVEAWGVIAAPRFVGRLALNTALPKFLHGGASRASPTIVPYGSLHSVSSILSLALSLRGGNFGVGGGPGHVHEGFLTAWTLLEEESLPGLWLVLTSWHPEARPLDGACAPECICQGVALGFALDESTADRTPPGSFHLRFVPRSAPTLMDLDAAPALGSLVAYLAAPAGERGCWACPTEVGILELTETATAEHLFRTGPHFPRVGLALAHPWDDGVPPS